MPEKLKLRVFCAIFLHRKGGFGIEHSRTAPPTKRGQGAKMGLEAEINIFPRPSQPQKETGSERTGKEL